MQHSHLAMTAVLTAFALWWSLPSAQPQQTLETRSQQQALEEERLKQALSVAEQDAEQGSSSLVRALLALTDFYRKIGRPRDALTFARRAAEIQRAQWDTDPSELGRTLSIVAALDRDTGSYAEALQLNREVLDIYRALFPEGHVGVAIALSELAFTYRMMGEYPEARRLYEEAIAMEERLGDSPREGRAITLHNLGALLRVMDEPLAALGYLEAARKIEEQVNGPDHPNMAMRLNVIGLTHQDMGEYAVALQLLERALQISESALGSEHPTVAIRLNNLAHLHASLGQDEQAIRLYRRALAINEKAFGTENERIALNLNGIALSLLHSKRPDEAREYAERALAIGERALGKNHAEVGVWASNLGQVLRAQGEMTQAQAQYKRALSIFEQAYGPRHIRVGGQLNLLSYSQRALGDRDEAVRSMQRALAIAAGSQNLPVLMEIQAGLGNLYADLGDDALAIFWGKEAVNTVQSIRTGIARLPPAAQRAYLSRKRDTYVTLADRLIAAGRLAEAHEVLAMLKEEELFDFIARSSADDPRSSRASFVGSSEIAAQSNWESIAAQLAQLSRESAELARRRRLGLTKEEETRRVKVESELAAVDKRLEEFLAGLRREFAADTSKARQRIAGPSTSTDAFVRALLSELGPDTALLQYVVAEQRVAIVLTTSKGELARMSPIRATELNAKVLSFRQELAVRRDVTVAAQELYRLLIEPVASDLQRTGSRTLMLSLDGTLRYLPFAALHDGQRYLIENYALAVFTQAARTQITRRPQRDWSMIGLGVTRAVPGFAALPAVRDELEGIRINALGGQLYFDEQFTADRLSASLTDPAPVLHIASHFQFRPGTYANSFLVLGDGGRLTLKDIRDRRLQFSNLDLLTLSGCDTAMGGGIDETGAEVEGFATLAQKQGASAVLATLWPVSDSSTGLFMQLVYGHDGVRKLTKAEAVRRAQMEFLRVQNGASKRDAKLAHPFYWAPYVLMGNWL